MGVKIKTLYGIAIAAMYIALVWILPSISFGPIQIRVADILSPLPYVMGIESVLGLTIGTAIANLLSPYGIWDVAIGTLCTFTYSIINYAIGRAFGYRKWLLPMISVIDALVVGIYIGIVLLSYIGGLGEPLYLFTLLTLENLVATMIGALVVVPLVRRYMVIR